MPWFRRRNADNLDPDPFLADEVQAQPSADPWGFGTGFRLTVQDVFTIAGRGSVVTGRVESGSITKGARVRQTRTDGTSRDVTVTGIEMFRKTLDSANAGDEVGLLLHEIGRDEIGPGDTLAM
jgi:translation elongation factor EF-Tu-like GTPase